MQLKFLLIFNDFSQPFLKLGHKTAKQITNLPIFLSFFVMALSVLQISFETRNSSIFQNYPKVFNPQIIKNSETLYLQFHDTTEERNSALAQKKQKIHSQLLQEYNEQEKFFVDFYEYLYLNDKPLYPTVFNQIQNSKLKQDTINLYKSFEQIAPILVSEIHKQLQNQNRPEKRELIHLIVQIPYQNWRTGYEYNDQKEKLLTSWKFSDSDLVIKDLKKNKNSTVERASFIVNQFILQYKDFLKKHEYERRVLTNMKIPKKSWLWSTFFINLLNPHFKMKISSPKAEVVTPKIKVEVQEVQVKGLNFYEGFEEQFANSKGKTSLLPITSESIMEKRTRLLTEAKLSEKRKKQEARLARGAKRSKNLAASPPAFTEAEEHSNLKILYMKFKRYLALPRRRLSLNKIEKIWKRRLHNEILPQAKKARGVSKEKTFESQKERHDKLYQSLKTPPILPLTLSQTNWLNTSDVFNQIKKVNDQIPRKIEGIEIDAFEESLKPCSFVFSEGEHQYHEKKYTTLVYPKQKWDNFLSQLNKLIIEYSQSKLWKFCSTPVPYKLAIYPLARSANAGKKKARWVSIKYCKSPNSLKNKLLVDFLKLLVDHLNVKYYAQIVHVLKKLQYENLKHFGQFDVEIVNFRNRQFLKRLYFQVKGEQNPKMIYNTNFGLKLKSIEDRQIENYIKKKAPFRRAPAGNFPIYKFYHENSKYIFSSFQPNLNSNCLNLDPYAFYLGNIEEGEYDLYADEDFLKWREKKYTGSLWDHYLDDISSLVKFINENSHLNELIYAEDYLLETLSDTLKRNKLNPNLLKLLLKIEKEIDDPYGDEDVEDMVPELPPEVSAAEAPSTIFDFLKKRKKERYLFFKNYKNLAEMKDLLTQKRKFTFSFLYEMFLPNFQLFENEKEILELYGAFLKPDNKAPARLARFSPPFGGGASGAKRSFAEGRVSKAKALWRASRWPRVLVSPPEGGGASDELGRSFSKSQLSMQSAEENWIKTSWLSDLKKWTFAKNKLSVNEQQNLETSQAGAEGTSGLPEAPLVAKGGAWKQGSLRSPSASGGLSSRSFISKNLLLPRLPKDVSSPVLVVVKNGEYPFEIIDFKEVTPHISNKIQKTDQILPFLFFPEFNFFGSLREPPKAGLEEPAKEAGPEEFEDKFYNEFLTLIQTKYPNFFETSQTLDDLFKDWILYELNNFKKNSQATAPLLPCGGKQAKASVFQFLECRQMSGYLFPDWQIWPGFRFNDSVAAEMHSLSESTALRGQVLHFSEAPGQSQSPLDLGAAENEKLKFQFDLLLSPFGGANWHRRPLASEAKASIFRYQSHIGGWFRSERQFFEFRENLSNYSWSLLFFFSSGWVFVNIFKNVYKKYAKEIVESGIDFLKRAGILDDVKWLKEELGMSDEQAYRGIRHQGKKFTNIIGLDRKYIILQLSEMVWFLKTPKFLTKFRIRKPTYLKPKGFLFTGPPGTGKTLLVQAIAGETGVPIVTQSGGLLQNPRLRGKGALTLHKLFLRAREIAPCIIFIDEVDGIGSRRQFLSDGQGGYDAIEFLENHLHLPPQNITKKIQRRFEFFDDSDPYWKEPEFTQTIQSTRIPIDVLQDMHSSRNARNEQLSILTQLLIELDGLHPLDNILVIGATNRVEILDPALMRPGRFQRILKFHLPDYSARINLFKLYTQSSKIGISKDIPWDFFSKRTQGLSSADIASIVFASELTAVQLAQKHTFASLERGIDLITSFPSDPVMLRLQRIFIFLENTLQQFFTKNHFYARFSSPSRLAGGERVKAEIGDIVSKNQPNLQEISNILRNCYYNIGKMFIIFCLQIQPLASIYLWERPKNFRFLFFTQKFYEFEKKRFSRIEIEKRFLAFFGGKAGESLFIFLPIRSDRLFESFKFESTFLSFANSLEQSNFGIENEIQRAQNLLQLMIEKWYFYLEKIATEKFHPILEDSNLWEYKEREKEILLAQALVDEMMIDLDMRNRLSRNEQKYSYQAWWMKKVATQLNFNVYMGIGREVDNLLWSRIYLSDPDNSPQNIEWVAPDEYFHTIFRTPPFCMPWTQFLENGRFAISNLLLLQSFNTIFKTLRQFSEFLDFLADYFLRHESVREAEFEMKLNKFFDGQI